MIAYRWLSVVSLVLPSCWVLTVGLTSGCSCSSEDDGNDEPSGEAGAGSDGGGSGNSTGGRSSSGGGSEAPFLQREECIPSGNGNDYEVGPDSGQLESIDDVPWESLSAGDTVRIHWRAEPYHSRFQISGSGTADKPIRVCGIRGENGQRPVIDGNDSTARREIVYGSNEAEMAPLGVVLVDRDWGEAPTYIVIDGLEIQGALPENTFRTTEGGNGTYDMGAACIRVQRGRHVIIRENVLHDCGNGIFTMSKDDEVIAEVTSDLLIEGNHIYGNGNPGSDREHNSYVQSARVIYQFNHYGQLRSSGAEVAGGSALKDRSTGTVIRYNLIEEGARSLDLVEPEDWWERASAEPDNGVAYVYGNIFKKNGETGDAIHYGGDSYEYDVYRAGGFYFYHNTYVLTGTGYIFQLSTIDQSARVFNNVFYADSGVSLYLRSDQDGGGGDLSGGEIALGVNWLSAGWSLSGEWDETEDHVTGEDNALTGSTAPIDLGTYVPRAGSAVIDASDPNEAIPAEHPVLYEYTSDLLGAERQQTGSALDLGAIEAR